MYRQSAPRVVPVAAPDAEEPYTPDAARSAEQSCAEQEVAEQPDGRRWEPLAARSRTLPALRVELVQLEVAPTGVQALQPQEMLLGKALPLGVPAQTEWLARRSPNLAAQQQVL